MAERSLSHLWPGVPLALASALSFGASTPLSKVLLSSFDPQLLAGLLYLGTGIGLSVVHLARSALAMPAEEAPLHKNDIAWLGAIILSGGIIGPFLLMLGLFRTQAASGALLLNLESLATMGLAWVVFRENVDRRLLLGAFAIMAGAVVLAWEGRGVDLDAGAVLIAGACLAWGVDNNLTRKLSAADPVVIAMLKGLVAGAVNTGLALWWGAALPAAGIIGAAALVGFVGIGVSLVLFVLGLRHLGAARTGAYFSLAPFTGALLAVAFLGEPLTAKLAIAGGLMGVGLWLHLAERHQHEHRHEGLEHEHSHSHDEHHQHVHDGPVTEPRGEQRGGNQKLLHDGSRRNELRRDLATAATRVSGRLAHRPCLGVIRGGWGRRAPGLSAPFSCFQLFYFLKATQYFFEVASVKISGQGPCACSSRRGSEPTDCCC
jgi:drug/metabolite transporter (DMT)-like permease